MTGVWTAEAQAGIHHLELTPDFDAPSPCATLASLEISCRL